MGTAVSGSHRPESQPMWRGTWPLLIAVVLGVVASAAVATIRVKADGAETAEAMAERYYGDARKAPIIRAANKLDDTQQPSAGAFLKIPGPTIHTATNNETLQKVADRFLSGVAGRGQRSRHRCADQSGAGADGLCRNRSPHQQPQR